MASFLLLVPTLLHEALTQRDHSVSGGGLRGLFFQPGSDERIPALKHAEPRCRTGERNIEIADCRRIPSGCGIGWLNEGDSVEL